MTIKSVLKIGNPFLYKTARKVVDIDEALRQGVIKDMLDTMKAEEGAGIAAPQIGSDLRIMIFGIEKNPRYPDEEPVPTTILINPEIFPLSEEKEAGWEGCLSVPNYRGLVPRYKAIRYSGYDDMGRKISREVCDFHARVVQHELDHLDGILYPQRITDLRNFGLIDELENAEIIPKIKND